MSFRTEIIHLQHFFNKQLRWKKILISMEVFFLCFIWCLLLLSPDAPVRPRRAIAQRQEEAAIGQRLPAPPTLHLPHTQPQERLLRVSTHTYRQQQQHTLVVTGTVAFWSRGVI